VRFEFFKTHRRELLALGWLCHWLRPFVTGLPLRRFSSAKKFRGFIPVLLGRLLWGKRGDDLFRATQSCRFVRPFAAISTTKNVTTTANLPSQ
jgi:hypothetical protein